MFKASTLIWLVWIGQAWLLSFASKAPQRNTVASTKTRTSSDSVSAKQKLSKGALATFLLTVRPSLQFSGRVPTAATVRSPLLRSFVSRTRPLMKASDDWAAECVWLGICASAVRGNGYGEAVERNPEALGFIGEDMKDMDNFVLKAVRQNGNTLTFASEDLRDRPDVVLAAVLQDANALEFAGPAARNNLEVMLAAVRQKGYALRFASESLKNDHGIVLAAVQQAGHALKFAGEDQKNNHEVVLAAVQQNGAALQYAGDGPRNDREIVLSAIRKDALASEFAGSSLSDDPEVNRFTTERLAEIEKQRLFFQRLYDEGQS